MMTLYYYKRRDLNLVIIDVVFNLSIKYQIQTLSFKFKDQTMCCFGHVSTGM